MRFTLKLGCCLICLKTKTTKELGLVRDVQPPDPDPYLPLAITAPHSSQARAAARHDHIPQTGFVSKNIEDQSGTFYIFVRWGCIC